jgi:hypothetical protein
MKQSNSLTLFPVNPLIRGRLHGILIISYAACLMLTAGCSKTIYPSAWQPTPVVTDGSLSDWTLPLPYYDPDTKLNYSITNDAQNLYIVFRTSDVQAQMKLLKAGFTLWIDTKGKKNELTGIRYPLPQALLPDHGESLPVTNSQRGEKKDMSKAGQKLIAAQKQMELLGFKNTANVGNPNGTTFLRTNEGIAVAVNADSTGELVYEATIPFKTFLKETITASDTIKPISIGMVENGLTTQGGHKGGGGGAGGGGGMGPGGMGGGMGGGMRGGGGRGGHGGGGSQGASDGSNETKTVWTYIKLSVK